MLLSHKPLLGTFRTYRSSRHMSVVRGGADLTRTPSDFRNLRRHEPAKTVGLAALRAALRGFSCTI